MIAVTFIATTATVFAISALMVYRAGAQNHNDTRIQTEMLLESLGVAETSQRGYLLTGDPAYLANYDAAVKRIPTDLSEITEKSAGNSAAADIDNLKPLVDAKLAEMARPIAMHQAGDAAGALEAVKSGEGQALTDQIRQIAKDIQVKETQQLAADRDAVSNLAMLARDISIVSMLATLGLTILVYWLYLKAIQSERRLDKAKDEFVSLASHQLRTPATGIKSILSTLVAGDFGPLNEKQEYFMKRALQSNERELAIIEELLNVAKADAGRLILHATPFSLDELIRSIAGEQRAAIAEKHQEFKLKLPNHPVPVVADEEKLYMAIGNLLDNARKYTPEEGELSLSLSNRGEYVRIEVTDSGIGIEPDEINHIFDRFHRASDALRGHVEGAGLGLYLAGRIIELHDGTIEVSSKPGKGTKFVMILPQGEIHAAEGAAS